MYIISYTLQIFNFTKQPKESDPPQNKSEYEILIKGYLNDINRSDTYIISTDIISLIALFYPFHFILEEKAIRICRETRLKDALKFLLKEIKANDVDIGDEPGYIARFLYYKHPYLNREDIGEFISSLETSVFTEQQHIKLMENYMECMDFDNLAFLDALKRFLNCGFFLPKEAPKIDKLIQYFADYYAKYNRHGMDSDDIMILSYGVLMLNTDYHNSRVETPMFRDAFRNFFTNRPNIPTTLVDEIFDYISQHPLIVRK